MLFVINKIRALCELIIRQIRTSTKNIKVTSTPSPKDSLIINIHSVPGFIRDLERYMGEHESMIPLREAFNTGEILLCFLNFLLVFLLYTDYIYLKYQ